MRRLARRGACALLALVAGSLATGLPWLTADAVGWDPAGTAVVALVLVSYAIAGLVAATVYTALNDGMGALAGLIVGQRRRRAE